MTRAEYNAKLQEVQEFCDAAGIAYRVMPKYDSARLYQHAPALRYASFQVYYGGWRELAYEFHPFTSDVEFHFLENDSAKFMAEVARDVSR